MEVKLSKDLYKELKRLRKKNPLILKQVKMKLATFQSDPSYKSLRKHKLTGNLNGLFSISVNRSIRLIYVIKSGNIAYFIAMGTHDEVYNRD